MKLVVFGAGGQAREVCWYLEASGHKCIAQLVAAVSDIPADADSVFSEDWLPDHIHEVEGFVLGVGSPDARLRIAEKIRTAFPRVPWPPIVHPSAVMDRSTTKLNDGVMVGAGAILTVNVTLAEMAMVNFGATVGHDTHVGRSAVINPGASVAGGVRVGDQALIGAGAVVLQYLSIGRRAVVGAGAVVTRDVADGITVVGAPARPTTA
jgi:sugar O-acyltransferase (sialic acid O-acetyltransferase NeuD family)